MADSTESVKPKAVATLPPQSTAPGVWGESESGLAPAEELQLVAQSFSWLKGQRFPTHASIGQIEALAQAENRKLTAPEVVVATAGKFLGNGNGNERPTSFRDALRRRRLILKACKIIFRAELMNQAKDHRDAGLAEC